MNIVKSQFLNVASQTGAGGVFNINNKYFNGVLSGNSFMNISA